MISHGWRPRFRTSSTDPLYLIPVFSSSSSFGLKIFPAIFHRVSPPMITALYRGFRGLVVSPLCRSTVTLSFSLPFRFVVLAARINSFSIEGEIFRTKKRKEKKRGKKNEKEEREMVRKQKGDDKGITPEGNNRGWVGRRGWVENKKKRKKR